MQKEIIHRPQFLLVGTTSRTNNTKEMNTATARILPTVQQYFQQGWPIKLLTEKHRALSIVFILITILIWQETILFLLVRK